MKYLIPSVLAALTIGLIPGEAEAHNRHRHNHRHYRQDHLGLVCHRGDCYVNFGFNTHHHHHRNNHNVRLNEHCVYKPHKDKVVCKY